MSGLYTVAATAVVGSTARDLVINFTNEDGSVRDLTGWTVRLQGTSRDLPNKTFDIQANAISLGTVTWTSFFGALGSVDLGAYQSAEFSFRPLLVDPAGHLDYGDGFDVMWLASPAVGGSPTSSVSSQGQYVEIDLMGTSNVGGQSQSTAWTNYNNNMADAGDVGPSWSYAAVAVSRDQSLVAGSFWQFSTPTDLAVGDVLGGTSTEMAADPLFTSWRRRLILRGALNHSPWTTVTANARLGMILGLPQQGLTKTSYPSGTARHAYVALVAIFSGTPHWELWASPGGSSNVAAGVVTLTGVVAPSNAILGLYNLTIDYQPAAGKIEAWVNGVKSGVALTDTTKFPSTVTPPTSGQGHWQMGGALLYTNDSTSDGAAVVALRNAKLGAFYA